MFLEPAKACDPRVIAPVDYILNHIGGAMEPTPSFQSRLVPEFMHLLDEFRAAVQADVLFEIPPGHPCIRQFDLPPKCKTGDGVTEGEAAPLQIGEFQNSTVGASKKHSRFQTRLLCRQRFKPGML